MFTTIPSSLINVGKAVKKEIFTLIKGNLDDHETRLNNLEVSSGRQVIFNGLISPAAIGIFEGVAYYTVTAPLTITEATIQIFEKDGLTGNLEIDIQGSTSTDPSGFSSIFSTKPKIEYPAVSDFNKSSNGVISGGSFDIGDVIRFDITEMPSGGLIDKFIINVFGE
jgi:hypothetical protein